MSFMNKFNLVRNKTKSIIRSSLHGENSLAISMIIKKLMKEIKEPKSYKRLDKLYKTKEQNKLKVMIKVKILEL
jgi:hypothetical protein